MPLPGTWLDEESRTYEITGKDVSKIHRLLTAARELIGNLQDTGDDAHAETSKEYQDVRELRLAIKAVKWK